MSKLVTLLLLAAAALAQSLPAQQAPPLTQVRDTSALHPPPGARVAIVEFVDLECPVCATTTPIVEAAAARYRIPIVRHDFLIPAHAWSPIAATNARWFDQKSRALGDQYRDAVFSTQPTLYNNPDLLRAFTMQFAAQHNVALPFAIDPQGKLFAEVKADNDLGIRTGIEHTPTVFVVTDHSKGRPWIEVQRPSQDLYTVLDQAFADTGATIPSSPAASTPAPSSSASSAPASAQPAATPGETTPAASQPASVQTSAQPPDQPAPSWFTPLRIGGILAALIGIVVFIWVGKRKST